MDIVISTGWSYVRDILSNIVKSIENDSSGFQIIFIRALPVNAAMFLTYEWTMNSLVRWDRGGRWV